MKPPRRRYEPVAGKPPGECGRYEKRQTLATLLYSALTLLIAGAGLVATYANADNVGAMLGSGTVAGSVALILVGICKLVAAVVQNNTNKRG